MTDAPDLDSPRSDSNCDLGGGENWSLSFPAPKGEGPGAPSAWFRRNIGTGATRHPFAQRHVRRPRRRLQRRELLLADFRADGFGSQRRFHRSPPFRLGWGLGPGFGPHAGRVPQRAGQRAEQSRFLAKGRGVIKLPLQQRQVAIRVTRFQRFFLLAACFLMVPAPVTFSNFAATRAG